MRRAGSLFMMLFALVACSPGVSHEGPFAPGIAQGGDTVDGLVVGHRLMQAGEFDLALDAFSRASADRGFTGEVLAALGSANLALGRLGQAEIMLRKALELEPESPVVWNNLGVLLMEQGNVAEAEQVFRRAFAFDNGESDAIRDNLRLALAKLENESYAVDNEQDYKLVRRGSGDFLIRQIP